MRFAPSRGQNPKKTLLLSLFALVVLLAAVNLVTSQTTPVTVPVYGHFTNASGAPYTNLQLRWTLNNCATGRPTVYGVAGIITGTVVMTPNSGGLVSGSLWPNDVINCGGITGQSRWYMSKIVGNVPQGPPVCYNVLAGTPLNLDMATPCPQITPPTPPGTANDATYRNVQVLGDLTVYGNANIQGPLALQNVNGILNPSLASGVDLAAKVASALASLGGTSAKPIDHAVIELSPGTGFTTSTITLPNSTTPPYVAAVDFVCNGSVLQSVSGAPLFNVLPQNSAVNNGSIQGCSMLGATGISVVQNARINFTIEGNSFQGGTVGVQYLNGNFQDGGGGYNEQHHNRHNSYNLQSVAGVEYTRTTGSDSAEYGDIEPDNHFNMPCGMAAIQVDNGMTIQGGVFGGRLNTTGVACTPSTAIYAIRNNGSIYRGTTGRFVGENTSGTSNFFLFGGSGDTTLTDMGTITTGLSLKPAASMFSHTTLPSGLYSTIFGTDDCAKVDGEGHGAGYLLNRKAIFAHCQQNTRLYGGGEAGNSSFDVLYFGFSGTSPETATGWNSTFRAIPGIGVMSGIGFTPLSADGTCSDSNGCLGTNGIPNPFVVSSLNSSTIGMYTVHPTNKYTGLDFGFRRPGSLTNPVSTRMYQLGTDFSRNGGTDFYLYSDAINQRVMRFDADGTPHFYKGVSCTGIPTSSYVVTDGVVTHC